MMAINKFDKHFIFYIAVCLQAIQGIYSSETQDDSRPNIVLVLTDDQGWNDVGYHNPSVLTPNIDQLASDGVKLENSYVQPVCTPSRAALLSGKYPYKLGFQWSVVLHHQAKFLPRDVVTLPQRLKEIGYSTHMIGKWHLGHCSFDVTPTARGFDSFYGFLRAGQDFYTRTVGGGYDFWQNQTIYYPPEGSYNTELFTDRAVEVINDHDSSSSPLFLYLAYNAPHFPLQVPEEYANRYPNVTDTDRKIYLGMVSAIDDGVGKVVQALTQNNLLNNTVFIFLSDNGGDPYYGADNTPLRGIKGNLYEGGTKSVGFVYSRHVESSGCKHSGLIHAVDWYPTILDIANHPKAKQQDIDGVSQWKYINKCHESGRNEMVYNIDDYVSNSSAIRFGRYKLTVGDPRVFVGIIAVDELVPANPQSTEIRLYDLHDDPGEQHDIASEKPCIVKMMMKKLNNYRKYSVPPQDETSLSTNITLTNGIAQPGWC